MQFFIFQEEFYVDDIKLSILRLSFHRFKPWTISLKDSTDRISKISLTCADI